LKNPQNFCFLEKSANVNKKGKSVKKFGVLYLNELNGLERVNIYLCVCFLQLYDHHIPAVDKYKHKLEIWFEKK